MEITVANGTIRNVHSPDRCAGERCCIHNPSSHSMRAFPQYFGRRGNRLMERKCPHGFFHPDPDDPLAKSWMDRRHNCDGCCRGCYTGYPGQPDWWKDDPFTADRRLLVNKAQCRACGDIIQSKDVYDFVSCYCGAIFVDGGTAYQHNGADSWDNFWDLSIYEDINNED